MYVHVHLQSVWYWQGYSGSVLRIGRIVLCVLTLFRCPTSTVWRYLGCQNQPLASYPGHSLNKRTAWVWGLPCHWNSPALPYIFTVHALSVWSITLIFCSCVCPPSWSASVSWCLKGTFNSVSYNFCWLQWPRGIMGFTCAFRNYQGKISTAITKFNFQLRFNFSIAIGYICFQSSISPGNFESALKTVILLGHHSLPRGHLQTTLCVWFLWSTHTGWLSISLPFLELPWHFRTKFLSVSQTLF